MNPNTEETWSQWLTKTVVSSRKSMASGLRWTAGAALVAAGAFAAGTVLPPSPLTPWMGGAAVGSAVVGAGAYGLSEVIDVKDETNQTNSQKVKAAAETSDASDVIRGQEDSLMTGEGATSLADNETPGASPAEDLSGVSRQPSTELVANDNFDFQSQS